MKNSKSILMLEHDADDRSITRHFFEEEHYPVEITYLHSSDELFDFLKQCDTTKNFPSLLLLNDLSGPQTAVQIIRRLKEDETTRTIPVVVLSGLKNEDRIQECYSAGASSYIIKPSLMEDTNRKIANFFRYWFETVEFALPAK